LPRRTPLSNYLIGAAAGSTARAAVKFEGRTLAAAGASPRLGGQTDGRMSITIIQILQAMVFEDGYIAVLRGPARDYKEHISVSRADGRATRVRLVFSRKLLNDLVGASFVKQDGPENEQQVTIFKLTDQGRETAKLSLIPRDSQRKAFFKDKLLSNGYPWPNNLDGKSIAWLKSEIDAIKREDGATDQVS
jgi:hypothetical protein